MDEQIGIEQTLEQNEQAVAAIISGPDASAATIAAGEKPGDPHTLTVNLTAFMRGV